MRRRTGWPAAAAALALLAGSVWGAGTALARLAALRREEAASAAAPPVLAAAPGEAIAARDADEAARRLARRLADAASAAGVRLATRPGPPPAAGVVAVPLVALGPEAAVRGFARAAEGDRPRVRLLVRDLRARAGAGVALAADAVAPWGAP